MVYSVTAANLHWLTAIPAVGCVSSVLICQQSPKEEKGKWMWRHKSLGLLTGMIVAPRLAYRIFNRSAYKVFPLDGNKLEHFAASATHLGLYGFMVMMPVSGIAMGYYGGKGLPFFFTTIPGVVKTPENKKKTGKLAGQVTNYLLITKFCLKLEGTEFFTYWFSCKCFYRALKFIRLWERTVNFLFHSTLAELSATFSVGKKSFLE
jgi:1,2-dihydroxy-3-keto-5-methylthiopentene dioxygenase